MAKRWLKKKKTDKIDKRTLNNIAAQAFEEYDVGVEFRKPREKQWAVIEDLYSMKVEPALYGRFNIPLPVMSGFVHHLKSRIDNRPVIKFTHDEEADYKKARKITAAFNKLTGHPLKNWSRIDRIVKGLSIVQGIGTYAIGTSSDDEGNFDHYFEPVDGYDFIQDPANGSILENQNFCGRDNIIKSEWDLKQGIKERGYNKENVEKLIATAKDSGTGKSAEEIQKARENRFRSFGMEYKTAKYVMPSQVPYVMTEFITTHEGKRYYLLFHRQQKIWVKCCLLTEVFGNNLYPYVKWAPYDDGINPWPLAPAEEMIPVTDAFQTLINQAYENRQKINWGQRAYDPDIFPDPSELEYIEDGLVIAKVPPGKNIANGIYEFKTSELGIQGTINLANFLDRFTGKQVGSPDVSKGVAERDKKVGVMEMELGAVSERFGLTNKEFEDAWQMLGLHFLNGMRENLSQSIMVKLVGEKGFEHEELTSADLTPATTGKDDKTVVDYDIIIQSSSADDQAAAILSQRKQGAIARWIKSGQISPGLACEMDLRESGWSEEDIKALRDVENEGNREIIAEAEEENEILGTGEKVESNRGATVAHIQRHIDFANNTKFSDDKIEDAKIVENIYRHASSEITFATENKMRAFTKMISNIGQTAATGGREELPTFASETKEEKLPPGPKKTLPLTEE